MTLSNFFHSLLTSSGACSSTSAASSICNQNYYPLWHPQNRLFNDPFYRLFLEIYAAAMLVLLSFGFLYSTYFCYPTINKRIYSRILYCIPCKNTVDTGGGGNDEIEHSHPSNNNNWAATASNKRSHRLANTAATIKALKELETMATAADVLSSSSLSYSPALSTATNNDNEERNGIISVSP